MTNRYVGLSSGRLAEVVPAIVGGTASAGMLPALGAAGTLDPTMMPTGVGVDAISVVASAALSAGNLINLWDNAGVINARVADSTAVGSEAHGFVLAAVALGAAATVYLSGPITGLTGLTSGAYYWLNAAGAMSTTPPATAGNVNQIVGVATGATTLQFRPADPVTVN